MLSAHTRKTSSRVTVALRLAVVTVGRSKTALGAFYRRRAARMGNAKDVTARKIAGLFYNAMRLGMDYRDPGADHYEQQYLSASSSSFVAVQRSSDSRCSHKICQNLWVFLREATATFARDVL